MNPIARFSRSPSSPSRTAVWCSPRGFYRLLGTTAGTLVSIAFVFLFKNLAAHSIDGSIHFVCMDWRHIAELTVAAQSTLGELKNLCVWVKDNGGMGTFYRSRHELIFAFKKGASPHINNFELGQHGR
jgi:hypothetical protein